jgi:tripeptide aminopeptidase
MATGLHLTDNRTIADLMEAREIRECLQWFTREKQWINEQQLQVCRIPAPTFLEQKRAEWMVKQFRGLGCETEIDRAGNVVTRLNPDSGKPYVVLAAHLDTVLAPRRPEDISAGEDGRFRGPGVSDNGAGLAALLAIARALRTHPDTGDTPAQVLLIANVGEEGEGNLSGMRYLCRQSPIAARLRSFLILDGPGNDPITWQALASRRFEVLFTGPGGHSWSDYGIGNPVHALSHTIANFAEKCSNAGSGPRSSFNFGTLEGGSSINSIPASARTKVDFRSENPQQIEEFVSLLTAAIECALAAENQRASRGKVSARIKEIGSRPGGQLAEDAPLLKYIKAVDAHLGIRARLDCASTDANIPLSMGLPAVAIGAGGQGGGAHTALEWYSPEGRDLALKRILLTVSLMARDPGSATIAE